MWQAVDRAWALYGAVHNHVDESDEHRCLLERHLQQKWRAQDHDPEELTCAGLAFLERLLREEVRSTRHRLGSLD